LKNWIALASLAILFISVVCPYELLANPAGVISSQGVGSIQGLGSGQVTIQQTAPKGIINWNSFNIAPGEVTRFIQPSSQSIILNRIHDSSPSLIFGSLLANGSVILLNSNGVLFGKGAQVNVNGLIASSLNITDLNFLNGNYLFEGNPLNSFVKNAGTIQTPAGGYVYLFAPNVENSGLISSPEGHITLAAGSSAYLSERPNGAGFLVQITAPAGEVLNLGDLISDGGRINLYGQVINQSGLIQANSIREKNGQIELFASQALNLKSGSRILAKGGDEGISAGGSVSAISDKTNGVTNFEQGALIDITGGTQGGNGGSAEVSGAELIHQGLVIGKALDGYTGGSLLYDPSSTTDLNVTQSDFDRLSSSGLSTVVFQAGNDINITGITSDLTSWAQLNPSNSHLLSFQAGHNINFTDSWINNDNFSGTGIGPPWNLTATAPNGNIYLTRTVIQTGNGNINLTAGMNIELAGGGGGYYSYLWTNGGNISLTAGGDLIAPTVYDGALFTRYSGIRLDGGNLTVSLGGNFTGALVDGVTAPPGFILTNGIATIAPLNSNQGGTFGTSDNYARIILGKGLVNVTAQKDIYLSNIEDAGLLEQDLAIIDPSNQVKLTSYAGSIHLKPYPDTYAIPGTPNSTLGNELSIYPASFSANAQQGDILIESGLKFWPSFQGTLTFQAWGNIAGSNPNQLTNMMIANPDPAVIIGQTSSSINNMQIFGDPTTIAPPNQMLSFGNVPSSILFKTVTGDIDNFIFLFLNPEIQKSVAISAGRDLTNFIAEIGVPNPDSKALVSAGRNMIFANPSPTVPFSGISFVGNGEGDILVKGNLDLGTSNGIANHLTNNVYSKYGSGDLGLIDIGVGGEILMTKSKIWSYNGANIAIHGFDGPATPVGGNVDVGTNAGVGNDLGIVTLRGGNIDILSAGDVNVNASRVSTISGGNINITSLTGSINAGYGSPDATVDFFYPIGFDFKKNREVFGSVKVPGSGIFTFDKDDPNPLPHYPPYPTIFATSLILDKRDSLEALDVEIIKQMALGHDVTSLVAQYAPLITVAMRDLAYKIVKDNFTKEWKLGDISLKAGNSIIIPPAGIRGKRITIDAPNLNLKGGQLSGDVTLVNVGQITGNTGSISGPVNIVGGNLGGTGSALASNSAASGSLGSLTGSTGGVSTQIASSASVISAPSAEISKAISDDVEEVDKSGTGTSGTAAQNSNGRGKKKGGGKKFQLKQGVVIEVDTEEELSDHPKCRTLPEQYCP
jgi:filamentous hemagglutinin family protein